MVVLSLDFPRFKKIISTEKTSLGINYLNNTVCEEFITHNRYLKENK
jgi:hypothetical protein